MLNRLIRLRTAAATRVALRAPVRSMRSALKPMRSKAFAPAMTLRALHTTAAAQAPRKDKSEKASAAAAAAAAGNSGSGSSSSPAASAAAAEVEETGNLSFWRSYTDAEKPLDISSPDLSPTPKRTVEAVSSVPSPLKTNPSLKHAFGELVRFTELHPFWDTKLFKAAHAGALTKDDYKYFFEQYYLFSNNFTRYVAGVMYRCEDDKLRSKLTKNLWDEGGGAEVDKRHSELFRKFLLNTFGIENPDKIQFADFTKKFVGDYLTHSCNDSALYASAFLSLGTEGIVSALYARLIDGMVKSGIPTSELDFFRMHVERDDEIAETLGELMFWYWGKDPNWASTCRLAADCALNLRKQFFDQLYSAMHERRMQMKKFEGAISFGDISLNRSTGSKIEAALLPPGVSPVHRNVMGTLAHAYSEERRHPVYPLNLPSTTCSMAISDIQPGEKSGKHRHAYEALVYVMEGEGWFQVEEQLHELKAGDSIYLPPWCWHQVSAKATHKLRYIQATNLPLIANYLKLTPIRQEAGEENADKE